MNHTPIFLCERCNGSIDKLSEGKILARPIEDSEQIDVYLVCLKCAKHTSEKLILELSAVKNSYLMILSKSILAKTPHLIWSERSLKKYLKWGLVLFPELFADMIEESIDNEDYRVGT